MEIPELFKQWIGSIVRHLLAAPLAYLAAKGIITGDMSAQTLLAATGWAITVGWSLWQKRKDLKPVEEKL